MSDSATAATAEPGGITTGVFKVGQGTFIATMFKLYGGWLLVLLAALVLAGVVLGIVLDLRFLILGLMVVFIVVPMAVAFFYFAYGLRRECFLNTVMHRLHITAQGITVTAFFENKDMDEGEEGERPMQQRDYFFPKAENGLYHAGSGSMRIPVGNGRGFLSVPYSAFASPDDLRAAVALLR